MCAYAVVDVETTGFDAERNDRIVEIAIVSVADDGAVEAEWCSLLNPGRDVGATRVHGITASDVVRAPVFAAVVPTVVELLRGRVIVAHNASFDVRFLRAELRRSGVEVALDDSAAICTMRLAGQLWPSSARTLQACCEAAGVLLNGAHDALVDAAATAQLLAVLLRQVDSARWSEVAARAMRIAWPAVPGTAAEPLTRGHAHVPEPSFLAGLPDRLPREPAPWEHEAYLATLDRALLDRALSHRERDALTALAGDLEIDRHHAERLHRGYLGALAVAALADGVVTPSERGDLETVAALLELEPTDVDDALACARLAQGMQPRPVGPLSTFQLLPGDLVVFTGEMEVARDEWCARASAVGLVPHAAVTKKVKLVVAADPDSLSGKARKAADYGIPIVSEAAFADLVAGLATASK